MPIDVMSAGPTPDTARNALDEAIRAFVLTAADAGTLEDALIEAGYEQHEGDWIGPELVITERHALAVAI